jgi:hypothetical protein
MQKVLSALESSPLLILRAGQISSKAASYLQSHAGCPFALQFFQVPDSAGGARPLTILEGKNQEFSAQTSGPELPFCLPAPLYAGCWTPFHL